MADLKIQLVVLYQLQLQSGAGQLDRAKYLLQWGLHFEWPFHLNISETVYDGDHSSYSSHINTTKLIAYIYTYFLAHAHILSNSK